MIGCSIAAVSDGALKSNAIAGLCGALGGIFSGGQVTGIWSLEDAIVDGSGNIVQIPGRIGGALANPTCTRVRGSANGRQVTTLGAAGSKMLALNDGVLGKAWYAISGGAPCVQDFEVLLYTYDMVEYPFSGAAAVSQAFYSGGLYAHQVDGVTTTAIPATGMHIYRSVYAGATHTGVAVGGSGNIQTWKGAIELFVRLSAAPSAGQDAAALAAMRAFCGN